MTTEKTPPPGKVWLTVEIDQDDFDSVRDVDIWDLDHVKAERGEVEEDPSDKCNRLLKEAETEFREAQSGFQPHRITGSGVANMARGAELLADAVKVLREEL